MGKLPPATQVSLLGLLAERGEKSALPVAVAFAGRAEEPFRLAGLAAIGRLGEVGSVPVLVEAMRAGGNTASTARESLHQLNAPGVNQAILAALQRETNPGRRGALIEVLDSRGATEAVPALLQEVVGNDAASRRPAMRALAKLAQPSDLPALSRGLFKTAAGAEREEAEKTMTATCARVTGAGKQADPVLDLYRAASPSERLMLLPVLGRIGGAKALEVVKPALASTDPATYQAGIDAISNWPDADTDVEEQLLTLARTAAKPADRAVAARAYVRVISQSSGLPDPARLARFQKAMELAERDEERNFILERVGEIHRIETLRFVVPCLDQPALATRAGNTVCDLAREASLRDAHKAEFEAALNKVVQVCKDQGVVDRAKRRLQGK